MRQIVTIFCLVCGNSTVHKKRKDEKILSSCILVLCELLPVGIQDNVGMKFSNTEVLYNFSDFLHFVSSLFTTDYF